MRKVLVIGGGAAGMMAAIFAARKGAQVTLLERNEKLGKKLYITGKGRCNVTNACAMDEFILEVPRNGRTLYSALSFFSPRDMMAFLTDEGCPVVTERGRRVFPETQKASDVTRTLERVMKRENVTVRLSARAQTITVSNGHVTGVIIQGGEAIEADAVIVATGGKSYPMTGSTGDGYRLLKELGHTIIPPTPALSALVTREAWVSSLQGLSLKNVELTLLRGKQKAYHELGEMLFTHFGVSGPMVIEASSHIEPTQIANHALLIDLKPALTLEQVDARLLREFEQAPNKHLKTVLTGLLPGKMAQVFPAILGFDDLMVVNQVQKELRLQIARGLKALKLTVKSFYSMDEAIVTRGGVTVREINAGNMESRLIAGLYVAGELLDIDAHTGGYNLQIAFSTGALAGEYAAE